jgi:hypothetical protein
MSKNYKEGFPHSVGMEKGLKNRGQVGIFVIVAVVIAAVILVIFMYPNLKSAVQGPLNPESYLKDCISPEVKNIIDNLGKHSGYSNLNEGYFVYEGEKIKYLCYVSGFYKTCVNQEPMLTTHFEKELDLALKPKAQECVNALVDEYKSRGYGVVVGKVSSESSIMLNKIKIIFDAPISVSKEGVQTYTGFDIYADSQMSELLSIAENVIEYESILGDSETTYYMSSYPNLRMEKIKLSEGTKVYKLSNIATKEQFIFASRSLAWPPGLALDQAGKA